MANFIQSLALQWDLWTGRYQAGYATSQEDIDTCIEILEEVRRKELNRVSSDSVIVSNAFSDEETAYQLVACKDKQSNKIVGCMRLTRAEEVAHIDSSRQEYQFDLFPDDIIKQLSLFTRLAVLKSYRNSPVALVIMVFAFLEVLDKGGQAVLMTCEPNLFRMYKRLGLRPVGPIHNSPYGGYRLPMICMPDRDHFKLVRSPALPLMKKIQWSKYDDIKNWYDSRIKKEGEIALGIALYEGNELDDNSHWVITEDLSETGLKSFLKNAISINCKEGDLLMADKDGGRNFGIILEGFVRIEIDGKMIAILSKGDVFGEMAFILGQNRSADVIAGDSTTKVILCSASVMKRMEKEEDKAVIWRNLARIMAKRVQSGNESLISQSI